MKKKLGQFFNSGMGYLPFKIIEGFFGIISLSLYSYLLMPELYGDYGIVNTTVMLTYLLSLGWLYFVSVRFVQGKESLEEKKSFYSNILSLQGIILFILIVGYSLVSCALLIFTDVPVKMLGIFILFFVGYTMNQFYVGLLLFVDKRWLNVMLMLLTSVLKPITVFLLFKLGFENQLIIFLGHGSVDLIIGIVALISIKPYVYFRKNYIDTEQFKSFFSYGFPLIGLTLTMYVLNISDRYIIRFFYSEYEVGLYVPNYSIASATFLMISYGLSRGFYPRLLSAWKDEASEKISQILASGIKNYLFFGLPAATGMLVLSSDIGSSVISKQYQSGYPIIGIVAFGMFFLGLAEYANKGWELTSNTKPIFKNSLIAAGVNLILNFIFIPMFGFIGGAYTTAFSFVIYFLLSFIFRNKRVEYRLPIKVIGSIIVADMVMILSILLSGKLPLTGYTMLISKIAIGMISYFAVIYMTGIYSGKKVV